MCGRNKFSLLGEPFHLLAAIKGILPSFTRKKQQHLPVNKQKVNNIMTQANNINTKACHFYSLSL